jgi:hypothetical protein
MRNALHLALAGALLAVAAGPAAADWYYTRWGMTPEEVVAASNGAVRLGPPPEGKTYQNLTGRALGTFRGAGANFHAFFHFDANGGLAKVALERIDGAACAELHAVLQRDLGRPMSSNRQSFATIEAWNDPGRGNIVRYIQVGELPCTITYERP